MLIETMKNAITAAAAALVRLFLHPTQRQDKEHFGPANPDVGSHTMKTN
jgi:hypothetical protein